MVRRRLVFYIEGYDPQGIAGYSRLFRREYSRFLTLWPLQGKLSEPVIERGGHIGHWTIETEGPNWRVETRYEFLNWDDLIKRDMARPLAARLMRVAACFAANLADGTIYRLFRASWRFGLFYLYPTVALAMLTLAAFALGRFAMLDLIEDASAEPVVAALAGGAIAFGSLLAGSRLGDKALLNQLAELWLCFRDWSLDRRLDLTQRIDQFARHLIARTRESDADEVLVVGHSAGGAMVVATLARALEIDPAFTRASPRFAVAGLGGLIGAAALHRNAGAIRRAVARVAVEPSVLWVECESRKDIINLWDFDPVAGAGIVLDGPRHNPLIWKVALKHTFAPGSYKRRRFNFSRLHFQFIMGNDQRALYDFFMFVCGPVPFAAWARADWSALMSFAPDGFFTPDPGLGWPGLPTGEAQTQDPPQTPSVGAPSPVSLRHPGQVL